MWLCKWCRKEFKDKEEAKKHAVACGIEFDVKKLE